MNISFSFGWGCNDISIKSNLQYKKSFWNRALLDKSSWRQNIQVQWTSQPADCSASRISLWLSGYCAGSVTAGWTHLASETYWGYWYWDITHVTSCWRLPEKPCCSSCWWPTVYPKKYAHGFCFAVLCCGYTLTDFPISIRLTSLALWQSNDCPSASKATLMNMVKYFMWINYERLHNHNKAKHNKTVCIFLGIYCNWYCYRPISSISFRITSLAMGLW